jgi:ATP-dependent Clp protease ATP-binding subunit ClpX
MDTSNILFICGGTFVGVEDIIAKRIGKKTIGFGSQGKHDAHEREMGSLLSLVTSDDILEFGMIPEFVGRLPILCPLMPLDVSALVQIMTEPRNALVRQYQKFFEMEGAELEFQPEALEAIAEKARAKDTGARGLRSISEDLMLEIMYELPDQTDKGKYVVTPAVVRGETKLFDSKATPPPPEKDKEVKEKAETRAERAERKKESA